MVTQQRTIVVFFLHVVAVLVDAGQKSYKGYRLVDIKVRRLEEWTELQRFLQRAPNEVDVWRWPAKLGDSLFVLLEPSDQPSWSLFCRRHDLQCDIRIADLQRLLDAERSSEGSLDTHRSRRSTSNRTEDELLYRLAGRYPAWDEIEDWLLDLNVSEPLVTTLEIGRTHENRSLYVLKLTATDPDDDAPAIWVDSGIHAREWITHTSVIYAIRTLIEGYYYEDEVIRPLVEGMVIYFMPVFNPDGYDYSHKQERMWRKNRTPPPEGIRQMNNNSACFGVDLNRNFNISWGQAGVSSSWCSIVYPGSDPQSELETLAVTDFILSRAESIHGYLSIHSFGQMVLSRWAYVNSTPPDNEELMELAKEIADKMTALHAAEYIYGTSPRILYSYSGGSPDWVRAVAGVKYSYAVEMRDLGVFGFALPASHILPAGEEAFQAILAVAKRAKEYGKNASREDEAEVRTKEAMTVMENSGLRFSSFQSLLTVASVTAITWWS